MGIAEAEAVADVVTMLSAMPRAGSMTRWRHHAYDGLGMRENYANVLVVAGRDDEAFAVLREVMDNPSADGPNAYRYDPALGAAEERPRFEQILQSAKPL